MPNARSSANPGWEPLINDEDDSDQDPTSNISGTGTTSIAALSRTLPNGKKRKDSSTDSSEPAKPGKKPKLDGLTSRSRRSISSWNQSRSLLGRRSSPGPPVATQTPASKLNATHLRTNKTESRLNANISSLASGSGKNKPSTKEGSSSDSSLPEWKDVVQSMKKPTSASQHPTLGTSGKRLNRPVASSATSEKGKQREKGAFKARKGHIKPAPIKEPEWITLSSGDEEAPPMKKEVAFVEKDGVFELVDDSPPAKPLPLPQAVSPLSNYPALGNGTFGGAQVKGDPGQMDRADAVPPDLPSSPVPNNALTDGVSTPPTERPGRTITSALTALDISPDRSLPFLINPIGTTAYSRGQPTSPNAAFSPNPFLIASAAALPFLNASNDETEAVEAMLAEDAVLSPDMDTSTPLKAAGYDAADESPKASSSMPFGEAATQTTRKPQLGKPRLQGRTGRKTTGGKLPQFQNKSGVTETMQVDSDIEVIAEPPPHLLGKSSSKGKQREGSTSGKLFLRPPSTVASSDDPDFAEPSSQPVEDDNTIPLSRLEISSSPVLLTTLTSIPDDSPSRAGPSTGHTPRSNVSEPLVTRRARGLSVHIPLVIDNTKASRGVKTSWSGRARVMSLLDQEKALGIPFRNDFLDEDRPAMTVSSAFHDSINALPPEYDDDPMRRLWFQVAIAKGTSNERSAPPIDIINNLDDEPCPPFEFVWVNHMLYGKGVPRINRDLQGCDCVGPCNPKSRTCACVKRQEQYAMRLGFDLKEDGGFGFGDAGLLKYHSVPIYECNAACGCSDKCMNRVVQHGRKVKISLRKTKNKGWGVFADQNIQGGTFIGIYSGEVLTSNEADMRGEVYDRYGRTYLFDLDFGYLRAGVSHLDPPPSLTEDGADEPTPVKYTIDAMHAGNHTRFLNHSCAPNIELDPVYTYDADPDKPLLCAFTSEDIVAGTELCFSYHSQTLSKMTDDQRQNAELATAFHGRCFCGAKDCVGFVFTLRNGEGSDDEEEDE